MPVCSLFLKGKASCFKAFNTCRKHTSGCLSWCFSSLTALQTTPCCYFPFFHTLSVVSLLQIHFSTMAKIFCPVQCVVISSEMPSCRRKKPVSVCQHKVPFSSGRASLTECCLVQRPFIQEENWCYHGKVASRLPQEGQRSPHVPPQPEANLQVWML